MWVRSQDNKVLEDVNGFLISVNNTKEIYGRVNIETVIKLGTYESEKRAFEVLDDIEKLIGARIRDVYKMPDI